MKKLLTLLILWFNGILSDPINRSLPNSRIKSECLIEYGIAPDINYNNQQGISPLTEEEMYCVAACIYRDVGIMKPDGLINTEKVEEYFGSDNTEEKIVFFSVLDACRDGNIHCSLVECMFRKLKSYVIKSVTPNTVTKGMLP